MIIYPIEGRHRPTEIDVSIIIPIYKSKKVIREQILRWVQDDGLNVEIIYVHNKCPQNSVDAIINEWNRRIDKQNFTAKVLMMPKNIGFGGACNAGAHYAKGKYLIFLNADTTVTPNWIKPMIDLFDDPSVGIVGNLQLKEGDLQGTIDSAGSSWFWDEENFIHIGRHCYKDKHIEKPIHYDEIPYDLRKVEEREMVTGCCFAITKKLYQEIGGFNIKYRLGYWEDSEICMTVREMGYKILFQPRSIVFHKLAHSGTPNYTNLARNKALFMSKWVDSGRIDKLVKSKRIIPAQKISNILIKRQGANGDVLLASAILPAIKKKYPETQIYFETKCPTVLCGHPDIDFIVNEMPLATAFQLVIDLDFAYERRPYTPIIQSYAEEAGVSLEDCKLTITKGNVNKPELDNYVVIHAGKTAWAGRNWIEERWDEIAVKLHGKGYKIVCIGRNEDILIPCDADCRNKTTVSEMATIIADSRLFIGIDSLPFQIAQTVGTPTVCFFGSIDPKLRVLNNNVYPITAKNLPCLGCHHRQMAPSTVLKSCPLGTLDCEQKLSVEEFWGKIEQALQETEKND